MNSVQTESFPSRWRYSPREEKTTALFQNEKNLRGELAWVGLNREVLIIVAYLFGFLTAIAISLALVNASMRMERQPPFMPSEVNVTCLMTGVLFAVIVSLWKMSDRYVTLLKFIHQHHAPDDTDHEVVHV